MLEPLTLDKLDDPAASQDTLFVPRGRLITIREHAYRHGFADGVQQAGRAREAAETEIMSGLAEKIQDISFTHIEAQKAVLESLTPLLSTIISSLLPKMAQHTLVPIVCEHLLRIAKESINDAIELRCAPENVGILHKHFSGLPDLMFKINISPDESAGPLDIFLLIGGTETIISLADVITLIKQETDQFLTHSLQEKRHG